MSPPNPRQAVNRQVDRVLRSLPKMASDLRSVRHRVRVVGVVLSLGLVGMGARASEIAIDQHEQYAARGNRQQLRSYTLPAGRGNIVDRNYVSMAVNDHEEHLVLNPRLIHAQETLSPTRDFLHQIFAAEHHATIDRELDPEIPEGVDPQKARKAYRRLKVRLDPDQSRAIRTTDLPGLRIERRPHRVYPRGNLAAHVLGRVDGEGHGNLGVELALDPKLRGHETSSPAYYAAGKKLLVDGHPEHGISRGDTVALTLDTAIQAMAEEEIDTLVANWRPVGASVIVLDPWSGEVLAMVNRPTFDPNHRIGQMRQTVNLASQGVYEPGSTVKAITVAAALEEGTIRKNQTFFCEEGRYQYTPQHAIRDTKRAKWLDVTQILAMSSNIGTTKIYSTLGKQAMHRWVRRFHFGERPDVQLPGATPGLLADWREWSDIKGANISFGQGMSASPLQVAAAFAALSNGGVYNAPTVVSRVINPDGETVWEHEPSGERVVRVATANTVLEMLTSVVQTKKGTGKNARVDGYRVAGKTSTAQKANPAGGYYEDQYYASFVGTLPADEPRVVILVSVDNPEGGHYGNEVAAPTFSRLGARIMTYYGVARDDVELTAPKPVDLDADAPELVDGFVADEDVEPTLPGRRKVAFTRGLPDFSGLTIPEVLDAADAADVTVVVDGTGIAVGQDVPPGETEAGTRVTVFFAPPA
jgi:cell division protein FtsI (penicillin-binding protein 3)